MWGKGVAHATSKTSTRWARSQRLFMTRSSHGPTATTEDEKAPYPHRERPQ